jgi:hypothetical protein
MCACRRRPTLWNSENFIKALLRAGILFFWGSGVVLVGSSASSAQITVRNPNNLALPDQKPQVLLRMACRVVADEFHVHDAAKLDFPLILVLGEPFHYTADDENQLYTIYLDRWDDTRFVSSAVMLASHRVVTKDQYRRMVVEILRRASQVSPILAEDLRRRH